MSLGPEVCSSRGGRRGVDADLMVAAGCARAICAVRLSATAATATSTVPRS
jgi:hypothetical protein